MRFFETAAPAALLVVALLLAGCGKGKSADTPAASAAAGKLTTVRLQVFGDPAELAAYQQLMSAYEAKTPGVKMVLIPVGKQKDHMAKLATAFAAGDPPDLFVLNFRRFGQFAAKGALAPLGDQLQAAGGFKPEEFYEPAVEAFRFGGAQVCLPQNASSLVVYYNKALFKKYGVPEPKAGWRYYQDFIPAAQKLTVDTNGDGKKDLYGAGIEPTLIRLAPFVWSAGGSLVNNLEHPSLLTLDRGPAQLGMSSFRSLQNRYHVAPPLAENESEDLEVRFARGGLAMLFESRRYTASLRDAARHADPKAAKLDWDVAPFPQILKPVSVLHADAYCMAAKAAQPEAARDFVAYALSDEGESLLSKSGRLVPSRIATAQGPSFLDPTQPPASAQVFLDALTTLKRTPNTAAWHEVESKADALLEEWYFEPPPAIGGEAGDGEIANLIRDAAQPLLIEDLERSQAAAAAAKP